MATMKALLAIAAFVGIASAQDPNVCRLPPEPGQCKAHMLRYYYNPEAGTCEQFVYGGCKGNKNRFRTIQDCWVACRAPMPTPQPLRHTTKLSLLEDGIYTSDPRRASEDGDFSRACRPAPETGLCLASLLRWYFDANAGRCKIFIYGGCGGNKNNYVTFKGCEKACLRS